MAGRGLGCRGEVAIYRSHDDRANFKIKVTLKKRDALVPSRKHLEQEGMELQTFLDQQSADVDVEECIFSWQEKRLSKREYDTYQVLENCRTALEKRYHEMIRRGKVKTPRRLFSYVDSDEYIRKHEINKTATTSAENPDSFLVKRMSNLKNHKIIKSDSSNALKSGNVTRSGNRASLLTSSRFQSMVLMADLNELDRLGSNEAHEAVLCVIEAYGNEILCLTPDFSNGQQPYVIETDNVNYATFEYTLAHASLPMSENDKQKEKEMLKKSKSRHAEMIKALVGNQLEMPPPGVLRTFLFGEIVSASGFEASSLYVNYIYHLPSNWTTSDDSQQIYGTTHSCSPKHHENASVAHFNFPFSVELNLQNQLNSDEYCWPRLFLEVWSQDFWNRYRIEGYGYVNVPFSPGTYEFEIDTWCPINNSLQSRLHRFFLGYGSELEGIVFSAAPLTASKSKQAMSSLGLYTESSGKLKIRMNIIHQALEYISKTGGMKNVLLNLKPHAGVQTSLLTVLDAFQHARHRLLAARENVGSMQESTGGSANDSRRSKSTDTSLSVTQSSSGILELPKGKGLNKLLSVPKNGEVKGFQQTSGVNRKGKKFVHDDLSTDVSSRSSSKDSGERLSEGRIFSVDRLSQVELNSSSESEARKENLKAFDDFQTSSSDRKTSGKTLSANTRQLNDSKNTKKKQKKKKKGKERKHLVETETELGENQHEAINSNRIRRRKKKTDASSSGEVQTIERGEIQNVPESFPSSEGADDFLASSTYSHQGERKSHSEPIMAKRRTSEIQESVPGRLEFLSDPLPVNKDQEEETFQVSSATDVTSESLTEVTKLNRKKSHRMLDKLEEASLSTKPSLGVEDSITTGVLIEAASKSELSEESNHKPKKTRGKTVFKASPYRRHRSDQLGSETVIASTSQEEAVLSIWNRSDSKLGEFDDDEASVVDDTSPVDATSSATTTISEH